MSVPSMRVQEQETLGVAETVDALMHVERTRWAMQIHDGLTQSVTSAIMELQTLRKRIEVEPEQVKADLKMIEDEIRKDLREIRGILFALQGDGSGGGDLEAPSMAGFVDDVVRRWGLHARVSVEGDLQGVPPAVIETAHGIVAEAVANAAKHSGSPDVTVRVRADGLVVRLEIEDRGTGIAVAAQDGDPHFGLAMMRARAEQLGGTIDIDSTPGNGTIVVACLPVGGDK